jgi:hypothetical protein
MQEYLNQSHAKTKITSISPGFSIGVQRSIFEVMYIDFYLGGGIRFPSFEYSNDNHPDSNEDDIFSPSYEGIYPTFGLKVGIGL